MQPIFYIWLDHVPRVTIALASAAC